MLNAPKATDMGYRGEVKVLLVNLGVQPIVSSFGERMGQLVFGEVVRVGMEDGGYPS